MRMSSIRVWSPAIGKDKESGPSYQDLGTAALFNSVQQSSTLVSCSKLFNIVVLCWYSAGTLLVLCWYSVQQAARSYHKRFRSVRTQVHTFVHTDDDDEDDEVGTQGAHTGSLNACNDEVISNSHVEIYSLALSLIFSISFNYSIIISLKFLILERHWFPHTAGGCRGGPTFQLN